MSLLWEVTNQFGGYLYPTFWSGYVSTLIATEEPAPPSELNPEAKIVEMILLKCLEKKKEDRYQNVG